LPKATKAALAVGAVALLVALVAGFFPWFDIPAGNYTLPNGYGAAYAYATGGSSGLSAYGPLGAAIASAAINNALVVVTFALVLFFWPAMLVSGLINEVGRTIRWQPALWGLIAYISAWVMMSYSGLGSVGYGGWLDLLAVVLFIVAYLLARGRKEDMPSKPAAPTPASPPQQPSGTR
jgi:hypothetical protein